MKTKVKQNADFLILLFALVLTSLGLLMIFSASAPYAKSSLEYLLLLRSDLAAVIGIAAMMIVS